MDRLIHDQANPTHAIVFGFGMCGRLEQSRGGEIQQTIIEIRSLMSGETKSSEASMEETRSVHPQYLEF